MKSNTTLLTLVAVVWPILATAQTTPGARISATVETRADGSFHYRYTVHGSTQGSTEIWSFDVDVSAPSNGVPPASTGLVHGPGYMTELSALESGLLGQELIPVAVQSPSDWGSTIGSDATARWVALQDGGGVAPGQALDGFRLISHVVPTLRRARLRPYIDVDDLSIEPQEDHAADLERYYRE